MCDDLVTKTYSTITTTWI